MSELKAWLSQPDDRDIIPVRGVVMRIAAEEIGRLETEVARLKAETQTASGRPERITFMDGTTERELVWTGDSYALPEGAETIDDVRAAPGGAEPPAAGDDDAAGEGEAGEAETQVPAEGEAPTEGEAPAKGEASEAPKAEKAAEAGGAAEAAAEAEAAEPGKGDAEAEGTGEDEDDEDFELPPEWQ